MANPGGNQFAVIGDQVFFNGAGSSDDNGDPLTFSWSLVSAPDRSTATLSGATTPMASFTADVEGIYVASLVVNDGFVDSDPSNVSAVAMKVVNDVTAPLGEAIVTINNLPPSSFTNPKKVGVLTQQIMSAINSAINNDNYAGPIRSLTQLLGRIDGCDTSVEDPPEPDTTDWIINCDDQKKVFDLINEAITYLSTP